MDFHVASTRQKKVHGFASGDMVKAVVPKGKYTETHVSKVRKTGLFCTQPRGKRVDGIPIDIVG